MKVKLKDICEVKNGYAFKSDNYTNSGIRVIRITNVQKGFVDDEHPEFYPLSCSDELNDYMLQENDLLLSLTGNVGRVALLNKEFLPAALNQRVACLRTNNKKILNKYLFYYLLSKNFENDCIKYSKGIAQKNMSTEWLKEYELDIVSINDQNSIICIFDKLYIVINKYKIQLNHLDTLIKARFVDMFGDIKKSDGIRSVKLGSICETVSGGTPSTKENDYYGGDIPWISTVALGEIFIGKEKAKDFITEKALRESATHLIPKDSIMVGTRVGVGKCSINSCDMCTNQDINSLINIDESNFNKVFLKFAIDEYCDYFNTIKKGATILGITTEDLKSINIPMVSLELQDKYVCFVRYIYKLKFDVQKSLEKTQMLFDSLMQQYFV